MLKNYIIIALRNIQRSKIYSFINIFGLSLGIACCLLLALYIKDEMSYDKHHKNLHDVYRVTTHFDMKDLGVTDLGSVSPPIAMGMKSDIPEVIASARLLNPPGVAMNLIQYGDNTFYEKEGFLADSTLFDVLTYEFIEGNPKKALVEANTVVITDNLAAKLFGEESSLDKMVLINEINFKITGVIRDNKKTHVHANFFTSMTSDGWAAYLRSDRAAGEWAGQNFVPTYVKLSPGYNINTVIEKTNTMLQKYGADDLKALGMKKTLGLEPVADIYLKSGVNKNPRITYLYVIATIALFILLIACINFMNLSTARATKRAGEIGVRKVMGALRSSLVAQVLGEAMFIVLFSVILSVILIQVALPYFNQLTGKSILLDENLIYICMALLVITIITGLVAGSYPAFYLSSFQPAEVLKGKFSLSNSSGWLRQSLVVFQFMIAITLVCGMITISRQLNFMQEQDLGFDAKAKIVLPLRTNSARKKYTMLQREILKNSNVRQVSGTTYLPGSPVFSDMMFYSQGGDMDHAISNRRNQVDMGYPELLDIKVLSGRTFTENRSQDSAKVILNRMSAERFGFTPEQAIGQQLAFDFQGKKYTFEVIGVTENYHQTSLKDEIYPTMLERIDNTSDLEFIIISVDSKDFTSTINAIQSIWKSLVIDVPFEYSFLDEEIQKQYAEDEKVSRVINSFTIIAMLISCLGLYGLSTYMAERRIKEIGIRKVLGASVNQIVGMMSTEFIKLILIAFILSVPLAWYAMNQWLENFAYRIPVSILVFVYAGLTALLIALLTVSFESLKAASTNPAKSLKTE